MRDTLKGREYFEEYIKEISRLLKKTEQGIVELWKEKTSDKAQIATRMRLCADFRFRIFMAEYSIGATLGDLKNFYLSYAQSVNDVCDLDEEFNLPLERRTNEGYLQRTTLFGLALIYNENDNKVLQNYVRNLDSFEREDFIWEKMILYMGLKPKRAADKLIYPPIFQPLWDCMNSDREEQSERLVNFVKKWHARCRQVHDLRAGAHLSKFDHYHGYWCFEAAAVAKMFDIDDSALEGHPHYPYDLRHGW